MSLSEIWRDTYNDLFRSGRTPTLLGRSFLWLFWVIMATCLSLGWCVDRALYKGGD